MVVVEVALEQGTLNGCLVRRLAQLGEVRLARREALELVSLRALLAAHTLVAVQAAGRQLEVAKLLEWSSRHEDKVWDKGGYSVQIEIERRDRTRDRWRLA